MDSSLACFSLSGSYASGQDLNRTTEEYRPLYHFSPAKGWMGDPDGLIHYKDMYHLFWWGHAISKGSGLLEGTAQANEREIGFFIL